MTAYKMNKMKNKQIDLLNKQKAAEQSEQIQVIGRPFVNHVVGTMILPLNYFLGKFDKSGIVFNSDLLKGNYKSLGYWYDLRPYLKRFIVWQHGNLCEYFAPNKTILRNCLFGKVSEIQEIRNPYLGTLNSVQK